MSSSILNLEALESGLRATNAKAPDTYSENDLHNIHLSRLFDASPGEFFQQYIDGPTIDSAHLRPLMIEKALGFLSAHPGVTLTLRGQIGESLIDKAKKGARETGIVLNVKRQGLPRGATLVVDANSGMFTTLRLSSTTLEKSLRTAGLDEGISAATHWNLWFKSFVSEVGLCSLKLRDEAQFFNVLRELSRFTALSLNYADVARAAQVSQTTACRWVMLCERLGLLDWIYPFRKGYGKRHLTSKPKLYWNAPSLAMWLMRFAYGEPERHGDAFRHLVENLLYLALKDQCAFGAHFGFLKDNNAREVPLIVESDGKKKGFFIVTNEVELAIANRNAKSYAKIGAIECAYCVDASNDVLENALASLPIQHLDL